MGEPVETLRARHGEKRYRWLLLLTVAFGNIASAMSSTIVNVAIPDMSHHFTLGQERAQWVSASFMIAMTLSMLLTPWLLQRLGLRRAFGQASLLLMVGGIVGGLSLWFPVVIAARVAEGIAAGVLMPIPNVIVLRVFPREEQGRAMGIFGFGVVIAPALGPSVGGLLVELFGWRSIFFVVVPFCVAALAVGRKYLPAQPRSNEPVPRLDWLGIAWVGVAVVTLLNGLAELGDEGFLIPGILIAAGIASAAGFVVYQLRSSQPLLRLPLFRHPALALGATISFIYGIALFASTYLLPILLQTALGYPPSQAGLVLLPATLALGMVMPLAGRWTDRMRPGWLVAGGAGLLALAFFLTGIVGPGTALLTIAAYTTLGRIGLGVMLPALSVGSTAGVPGPDIPQAASMMSFLRQLGGAIGIALGGMILEWRLLAHGTTLIAAAEDRRPVVGAFDDAFLLLAALCAVAALLGLRMKSRPYAGGAKP